MFLCTYLTVDENSLNTFIKDVNILISARSTTLDKFGGAGTAPCSVSVPLPGTAGPVPLPGTTSPGTHHTCHPDCTPHPDHTRSPSFTDCPGTTPRLPGGATTTTSHSWASSPRAVLSTLSPGPTPCRVGGSSSDVTEQPATSRVPSLFCTYIYL